MKSPLGVLWKRWEYVPCSARPVPSSALYLTGWAVLLTTQLQAQVLLYIMLSQSMQQCTEKRGAVPAAAQHAKALFLNGQLSCQTLWHALLPDSCQNLSA